MLLQMNSSLFEVRFFSITIPGKLQTYLISRKFILGMIDGEGSSLIKKAQAGLTCSAEDYRDREKCAEDV